MSDDSTDLVERLKASDAAAESDLDGIYGRLVRRIALSHLHDPEAARDVAQETLLTTILAIRNGTLRETHNLGGFIYGTARNVIRAWIRRNRQEDPPSNPGRGPEPSAGDPPDLDAGSRLERALHEVCRLPAVDRSILRLLLVDGLTSEEVGERLGLTAQAVRKRKSRALDTLKRRLRKASRPARGGH